MGKIYALILLMFISSCVFAQNSTVRINESNTKITNKITVNNSTNKPVTGIIFKKYENGSLWMECEYKNGLKSGSFRTWYENGKKELESNFINDVLNGVSRKWYESGNLEMENYVENGLPNGLNKEWFENGQLKIEYFMVDGRPSGIIKTWYESGLRRSEAMIKDGVKLYKNCWDENGIVKDCK
jgi:antitoxin component YwqK of YwqJK toxin-antitoxin module